MPIPKLQEMSFIFVVVFLCCFLTPDGLALSIDNHRRAACDYICEDDLYEPKFCGTDGILYKSFCEFERAHCVAAQNGITLNVASSGECVTLNSTCQVFLDSGVKCNKPLQEFVCGTNNITYNSICEFMDAKCHRRIDLKHMGACVYDISSTTKLECGQFIPDYSNIAFENGTVVEVKFSCNISAHDEICLLGFQPFRGKCQYCEMLYKQGAITQTNSLVYIQHDGRCIHTEIVG